jgi:CRP-like cAMP-binding protein
MFRNQTGCQSFRAGETIFHQGEPRTFMFVVNEGDVEIRIGHTVAEVVGPGGIFGEMAMIDNSPRSATAVARSDCKLCPIDEKRFQFLVQQTPYFALEVLRVMANRLRHADQFMEA